MRYKLRCQVLLSPTCCLRTLSALSISQAYRRLKLEGSNGTRSTSGTRDSAARSHERTQGTCSQCRICMAASTTALRSQQAERMYA